MSTSASHKTGGLDAERDEHFLSASASPKTPTLNKDSQQEIAVHPENFFQPEDAEGAAEVRSELQIVPPEKASEISVSSSAEVTIFDSGPPPLHDHHTSDALESESAQIALIIEAKKAEDTNTMTQTSVEVHQGGEAGTGVQTDILERCEDPAHSLRHTFDSPPQTLQSFPPQQPSEEVQSSRGSSLDGVSVPSASANHDAQFQPHTPSLSISSTPSQQNDTLPSPFPSESLHHPSHPIPPSIFPTTITPPENADTNLSASNDGSTATPIPSPLTDQRRNSTLLAPTRFPERKRYSLVDTGPIAISDGGSSNGEARRRTLSCTPPLRRASPVGMGSTALPVGEDKGQVREMRRSSGGDAGTVTPSYATFAEMGIEGRGVSPPKKMKEKKKSEDEKKSRECIIM